MAKIKIYAPNTAYAGTVGGVSFAAGVAEVDSKAPEMAYFKRRGYGIGEAAELPDPEKDVDWPDPHTHQERFGSPLRDAAVDPEPGDYLAPVNAGEAHPHSSKVVSPGIHAVGPAPIRPGEVYVDDADRQETEEKALAEAVLIDRDPATMVATEFDADSNMGPLGLSDPGSVEMGLRGATEVRAQEAEAAAETAGDAPANSAVKAKWVDYAVARGMSRDEAEDLPKAELQKRYG